MWASTGIGGGLLLLPLRISVLGVPLFAAVGSNAAISCITKIGAGARRCYHGNVRCYQELAINGEQQFALFIAGSYSKLPVTP